MSLARLTLDQQITKKVKFGGKLGILAIIYLRYSNHSYGDLMRRWWHTVFLFNRYRLTVRIFMPIPKSRKTLAGRELNYPYVIPLKPLRIICTQKTRSRCQLNLNAYRHGYSENLAFSNFCIYFRRQDRSSAFGQC